MKYAIILSLLLTGCANGWTPLSKQMTPNGQEVYWLTPLPSGDGPVSSGGRSAGVTTYQGTINGRGYSVSSFR